MRFRDYLLPIIEIDFDETVTLDEMIQLFVDINQYGVKVKRFDIVKALYLNDPLLLQIFNLIALRRKRPHDTIYKIRNSAFSRVLKHLDIVSRADDTMNRVDIMWEKLFELALFTATGQHRKPVQILKEFIGRNASESKKPTITRRQVALLSNVFGFIATAYKGPQLLNTRWASDQTHFYILATALINQAKLDPVLSPEIAVKLIKFDSLLSGKKLAGVSGEIVKKVKEYSGLSAKQTTDVAKRQNRETLFTEILQSL